MFKTFYCSRQWALWAYGGGLFLLISIWLQVSITVYFNAWYADFYNLLQQADTIDSYADGMAKFTRQLIGFEYLTNGFRGQPSFSLLAFPYIIVSSFSAWFSRLYVLRWREAMTFGYVAKWRHVEQDIEGSSQRIQEDCARFAVIVQSVGAQVVRAIMTLFAFTPILWGLSEYVMVPFLAGVSGSLVWASLLLSMGGLLISWFVGIKLPGLEYNNQKVEAAFRKELVYAEDDKKNYGAVTTIAELFCGVRLNHQRLYLHYTYFDLWLSSYSQFMIIFPYLLMGPSLFSGVVMLGTLVQVANAFDRVHGSFSLFLDNWVVITELRSIIKRLSEFQRNIGHYDSQVL